MECPDDETFAAFAASELSSEARETLANHAAVCDVCHAVVVSLRLFPDAVTTDRGEARLATLAPGVELGRYTIERRIGVGGMGVVYLATDRELERSVAVKVLRTTRARDQARIRLLREARTLAQLSHPNIVSVFDVGEHGDGVFVVMELIENGNLRAWRARSPRTTRAILDCLIGAARGLAAAHAAGFVHRDVKPDNILVGSDDRARLTDFGLVGVEPSLDERVTSDGSLTETGAVLGTTPYMAPEVELGRTSILGDQWAFAATAYEVLAGVRPFPVDSTRTAAIAAGQLSPPSANHHLGARARAILARALDADPRRRWPDMPALERALLRTQRRPRVVAVGVGLIAVLAIAATTIALAPRRTVLEEAPMTFVDQRPGCDCPYSACRGRCMSVCSAPAYRSGSRLLGLDRDHRQESLHGASADGRAVLYLSGERCRLDHLYLAHQFGEVFVPVDLTDQIDRREYALRENCCTLTSDGETLILSTTDRRQFVAAPVVGNQLGEVTPLYAPPLPPAMIIRAPVLSADRLTLYFRAETPPLGDPSADGTFQAVRTSVTAPFGLPNRIPGVRPYEYVSGISSDGLSLFFKEEFGTRVMVRATVSDEFGDPEWTIPPATMHGVHAVPLGDCRRVIATNSPGGCDNEYLFYLDAVE